MFCFRNEGRLYTVNKLMYYMYSVFQFVIVRAITLLNFKGVL